MQKIWILIFLIFTSESYSFSQIITTIAGNGKCGYTNDGGLADTTEICAPYGVAVDKFGNVYIADKGNGRIRKINASGIINTIAGNGVAGAPGDGGPATAAYLNSPWAVVVDKFGNVYIADVATNVVRVVDTSGIIRRFAGKSSAFGSSGDGGPATAAEINFPSGLAIDTSGNLYIADQGNNRIRKVNTSGIISTIAGNIDTTGFSGDGGLATLAKINNPTGVAVDVSGNVYFADANNQRIRKINTNGIITTVAGNGNTGYSGDGMAATATELYNPIYVTVDASNNIYIADKNNYRIREVSKYGVISTVAGNGTAGFSGDGGLATLAKIDAPYGIATDVTGGIYITDIDSSRIRKVATPLAINQLYANSTISVYPNPSNGLFFVSIENINSKTGIEVFNMLGQSIYQNRLNQSTTEINLNNQPAGIYLYRVVSEKGEYIASGKLIIE